MVVGAGVFGSSGVVAVTAFLPCILRLKPFASLIFPGVASVASSALVNFVDKPFTELNSVKRSFTLLLNAVLSVTTVPISVCPVACNAIRFGNFSNVFVGLYGAP